MTKDGLERYQKAKRFFEKATDVLKEFDETVFSPSISIYGAAASAKGEHPEDTRGLFVDQRAKLVKEAKHWAEEMSDALVELLTVADACSASEAEVLLMVHRDGLTFCEVARRRRSARGTVYHLYERAVRRVTSL